MVIVVKIEWLFVDNFIDWFMILCKNKLALICISDRDIRFYGKLVSNYRVSCYSFV